jgi:hypothetical protein
LALERYALGSTLGDLTALNELGVTFPISAYRPYSDAVMLASGQIFGRGFPVVEWHWAFISLEERAILKAFTTGLSGNVYLTTLLNDHSWATFSAVMHWPSGDENLQYEHTFDLSVTFTHLVGA